MQAESHECAIWFQASLETMGVGLWYKSCSNRTRLQDDHCKTHRRDQKAANRRLKDPILPIRFSNPFDPYHYRIHRRTGVPAEEDELDEGSHHVLPAWLFYEHGFTTLSLQKRPGMIYLSGESACSFYPSIKRALICYLVRSCFTPC